MLFLNTHPSFEVTRRADIERVVIRFLLKSIKHHLTCGNNIANDTTD